MADEILPSFLTWLLVWTSQEFLSLTPSKRVATKNVGLYQPFCRELQALKKNQSNRFFFIRLNTPYTSGKDRGDIYI